MPVPRPLLPLLLPGPVGVSVVVVLSVGRGAGAGVGVGVGVAGVEEDRAFEHGCARVVVGGDEEVVRAIAKCDEGTYGTCDGCGAAIPAERLEAVPQATRCIACARAGAR